VLLLQSCFGLQHPVNICEHFGSCWDIKFNPLKSQLMTYVFNNPNMNINLNSLIITLGNKAKYLRVHFYGQFNNIMSVFGKGSHDMNAIYVLKT